MMLFYALINMLWSATVSFWKSNSLVSDNFFFLTIMYKPLNTEGTLSYCRLYSSVRATNHCDLIFL